MSLGPGCPDLRDKHLGRLSGVACRVADTADGGSNEECCKEKGQMGWEREHVLDFVILTFSESVCDSLCVESGLDPWENNKHLLRS